MALTIAASLTVDFRVHGHFAVALLVVLSRIYSATGDTVRLTMVTPTPYGAGATGSSASFTCFRSSPDTGVALSFGRPFQPGLGGSGFITSTSLPTGSTSTTSNNGQAVTRDLTFSNDATGLFYCEGSNSGMTTRVYSIIHSVYRRFEPVDGQVTQTVSQGEDAVLSLTSANSGDIPLWRLNRNGEVTSLDTSSAFFQMFTVTVPSSMASDGDLYATIQSGLSLNDNHFSMIRLIVRGCAAGRWGPPACVGVCDMCYNGGVCDDETGNCICPPGFMGPNCLTGCGMHTFGWNCEFQCRPGYVIQSCIGSQFGLPDPYGNSCISGYMGRDCNTVCSAGTFGAGCIQTCHCLQGTCDIYTGVCSSGCAVGWYGTNCQIPDVCTVGYFGVQCTDKCSCPNNAACDKSTGQCLAPCDSNPCGVGFSCITIGDSYSCQCPPGYIGTTCEIFAPCVSSPCQNGATCNMNMQTASFSCQCQPGYYGTNCETFAPCVSSPCQNGATCNTNVQTASFSCQCQPGYYGTNCEVFVPCGSNPCQNDGECISQPASFICRCMPGYYGTTSPCVSSPCMNGGTCRVEAASFVCQCTTGFSGNTCLTSGFQIICAMNVSVLSSPGSTVSVTIPQPYVPGGLSVSQVYYHQQQNPNQPLIPVSTGLQVSVPMRGSRTLDIRVVVMLTSGAHQSCIIPVIVSGPPFLSQPPSVTVESTSANVSWEAWGSNPMDTGDGPVTTYRVYYSPASSMSSTAAGNVSVNDQPQAEYSFVVQPLEADTQYNFSVAAVRDEQGGEGPRSPPTFIMTLPLPIPTSQDATTRESTVAVNPPTTFLGSATTSSPPPPDSIVGAAVGAGVAAVILLIVMVLLIVLLIRRIRGRRSRDVKGGIFTGKFESNNDLASLHTIDNPVRISMEDLNSNGGIVPATTTERPVSGASQISTLDSSSPFAGLPLLPSGERELKRQPVPLKDFVEYVHNGIQNGRFRDEWENLPGLAAMCSCDVSQQGDNKMKNRYRNVPAYDHCRVKLDSGGEDTASDYINASYIKGYMNDKAYIATQGPNQATTPDFWRMVWQENVHTIIICTNLVEDGKSKCVKYWPDLEQAEIMNDISIKLQEEELKGEYTVRRMSIAKVNEEGSVPRKVTQFHYTTWPDKGVPKDATPVLKFIQDFSDATPKDSGPFLVHCSAGVGRTGAVIALHGSLKRARAEKTVDVYNFVADMRDHRISIVQTPEQYTFIHIALLEALFAGDTCIPASALKKRLTELKKKKKLAEEFEQLRNITPLPNQAKCRNSLAPDNGIRNRFPDTLIPEVCRPYLMTPREDGEEYNYINATFVDGFKQRDMAIMTQAPLPNTVLDLWRLVYDYAVSSIVMLNTLDPEDPKCPQYWPDKGSEDYGPFDITVSNSLEKDGFNVRLLQMVHRRQTREHFLTHYQFTDWPEDQDTPASPDAILRLILEVEKDKGNQKRSLILVHCINGLDRSGVFCTVKNSLDRLRQEDVVDIMQTVKVLRFNRPNMLTSLNQYRFCYEAMQAYIVNREKFESSKSEERLYENLPSKNETPQETIYQNVESTAQSSDA